MVERIDEVSSKLQLKPLCNLEVLVHTQVYVGVMRGAQVSELIWATAEGPRVWRCEVAIVGEPLEATDSRRGDRGFSSNGRNGIAIGARTARIGPGLISYPAGCDGQGEPCAEADDRANRPAADNGAEDFVHVMAEGLSTAKGKLINRIG